MKTSVMKEITPLTQADCFTLFSRVKSKFDFPLHYHEEFELNFIVNAKGARRVVGDHIEQIDAVELVLVGPNLQHAWFTYQCESDEIREITIQFHKDLFDDRLLHRNQLAHIRSMLEKAARGILFSTETANQLSRRILDLNKKTGFDSVLELMSILHDLSTSRNMRTLSEAIFNTPESLNYNSRRIEKCMHYLYQNFDKNIMLSDVSKLANMADAAFSRFFKVKTGMTFIDCLTEIRLGHASRMLIDTSQSVAEVAYNCGFNNMSNFNRIFKRKKGCTPKEFRENFSRGTRVFI
jgi:AraC-like DNA-binding protein